MNEAVEHVQSTPAWSPYVAGALIGLLALATLSVAQHKVSASSAYANVAGLLGRLVAPRHVAAPPLFRLAPSLLLLLAVIEIVAP